MKEALESLVNTDISDDTLLDCGEEPYTHIAKLANHIKKMTGEANAALNAEQLDEYTL